MPRLQYTCLRPQQVGKPQNHECMRFVLLDLHYLQCSASHYTDTADLLHLLAVTYLLSLTCCHLLAVTYCIPNAEETRVGLIFSRFSCRVSVMQCKDMSLCALGSVEGFFMLDESDPTCLRLSLSAILHVNTFLCFSCISRPVKSFMASKRSFPPMHQCSFCNYKSCYRSNLRDHIKVSQSYTSLTVVPYE